MPEFELPPTETTIPDTKKGKVASKAETKEEIPEEKKSLFKEEDLLKIFDEIIFAGEYSEDVVIKGKLRVKYKTRTAQETEEITSKLDSTTANLVSTFQEKRLLLNLHYSLISYQGKDLSGMKVEDRAKVINQMPTPIVASLINALQRFDTKVYEACKEGEENF
jgi:hypothetical protein